MFSADSSRKKKDRKEKNEEASQIMFHLQCLRNFASGKYFHPIVTWVILTPVFLN